MSEQTPGFVTARLLRDRPGLAEWRMEAFARLAAGRGWADPFAQEVGQ